MLLPRAAELDLAPALARLDADGFAPLGPVLGAEGLEALRARAAALMLGEVAHPGMFFQLDATSGDYRDAPLGLGWQGPSLRYRKLEKLELDPLFLQWLRNPLFERAARARIAGEVALYRAILFNKSAQGSTEIPWHQDGGRLWGLSQEPALQVWTALDDAPRGGGCLEFVPGSHRGGLATPLGGVVPAEQVAAAGAEARAVPLPAAAGEAVLLHPHVWHRSGKSLPGARRLGFSICLMSAAARCVRKKKAPRAFFRPFG